MDLPPGVLIGSELGTTSHLQVGNVSICLNSMHKQPKSSKKILMVNIFHVKLPSFPLSLLPWPASLLPSLFPIFLPSLPLSHLSFLPSFLILPSSIPPSLPLFLFLSFLPCLPPSFFLPSFLPSLPTYLPSFLCLRFKLIVWPLDLCLFAVGAYQVTALCRKLIPVSAAGWIIHTPLRLSPFLKLERRRWGSSQSSPSIHHWGENLSSADREENEEGGRRENSLWDIGRFFKWMIPHFQSDWRVGTSSGTNGL